MTKRQFDWIAFFFWALLWIGIVVLNAFIWNSNGWGWDVAGVFASLVCWYFIAIYWKRLRDGAPDRR